MDSTRQQSGGFRSPERWNSVPVPERVAQRAYERVEVDENGCWISTYSVASHGYAQIGWQKDGKTHMVLAHRAAWVHVNGQMPLGMTLDHLCKAKRCVNPEHLRMLPNYENARRTSGRDWPLGYCVNGHPNSELVKAANGPTNCGICARESRERYALRVASGEVIPRHTRPARCRRGHDMTGDNAGRAKRGEWFCKACRRASQNAYTSRKREARNHAA